MKHQLLGVSYERSIAMKKYSKEEFITLTRQIISGKLASSITHKAKNILMPITGYAELIEGGVSKEKAKGYFRKIESAGAEIQSLLKGLLHFTKPPRERREEEIDILILIEDIIFLFGHYMIVTKVALKKDISCEKKKVRGVYGNISLLLASVVLNAIEATPPGGIIRLKTELMDKGMSISITDDGPGVSEEIKDKIFEPFFTTKKGSLGLGLTTGLFLARDMSADLILKDKNNFIISL